MRKAVVIVIAVFFLGNVQAAAIAATVFVTKANYPMAHTMDDLDLFHQSILQSKTALFLKLQQRGRAWLSQAGVEVYILEEESGKIKIKPINSDTEIWTLREAVTKKE